MKFLSIITLFISTFAFSAYAKIDLSQMGGKFELTTVFPNNETSKSIINVEYFPHFKFDDHDASYEGVKFGDQFMTVLRSEQGVAQLFDAQLASNNSYVVNKLVTNEAGNVLTSQPNDYTRMRLEVVDRNHFSAQIFNKECVVPLGPHLCAAYSWPKVASEVLKFSRVE